eukprot:18851-Heterococcus_DN1.PRE.1
MASHRTAQHYFRSLAITCKGCFSACVHRNRVDRGTGFIQAIKNLSGVSAVCIRMISCKDSTCLSSLGKDSTCLSSLELSKAENML